MENFSNVAGLLSRTFPADAGTKEQTVVLLANHGWVFRGVEKRRPHDFVWEGQSESLSSRCPDPDCEDVVPTAHAYRIPENAALAIGQ